MSAGKMVFDVDEARRLQAKISQVSEDTNRLYLQLKGQASQWDGLPLGTGRWQAQVLINELTVEAEKLEDLIRMAVKGVQDVQDESKRQASQISQQFSIFGGMFGNFGAGFGSAGRSSIPAFAQKISTNLISSIAILSGKDILNSDPMVRKLLDMIKQSGLGTVDSIAAQSKLKDIYEARDQIAKAQTAFVVYQAFGNQAQMDRVHQLAEEARAKLKSFGVDEAPYQAGKDLSVYFKQPAVQACEYDPSITSGKVPLVQNEAYQLLLRMAMEQGKQGDWAKGQLEGIHATMKQMIAAGVNLGVHMMTNQGAEAWRDVARLTSSFAQLESYNLFKSKAPDEQAGTPEKSKNAFLKSLDSFKEIGTGFVNTLRIRADKATDSPYDFVNWITLGIAGDLPVGIYKEAKARADHMLDSPEKFADWLTLGTVEMGKGAFHPEESWSAEHWLNSLGIASLLVGPLEKSLLSTGGKLPKPMISKDVADNGMDILSKEKGGQVVEGAGEVSGSVSKQPIQIIQNRYPNEIQQGKSFEYVSENGQVKIRDGIKEVDFVIDVNGNLKVGRGHSHLANGADVQTAGKLKFDANGNVRRITNESGHYTPTTEQAKNYEQIFNSAGIKTENAWLEIYQLELMSNGYVDLGKLKKVQSTKLK
jgi:hypothetical protein